MKTEQLLRWVISIHEFILSGNLKEIAEKWKHSEPWRRPYPPFVMTKLFQSDEENPFISDNIYKDRYSGVPEIFDVYEKTIYPIARLSHDSGIIKFIETKNLQSELEESCRFVEKQLEILLDWFEGRQSLSKMMSPSKAPSDFPEAQE